ncbi:MAG: hypothetical protein ABW001_02645 [Mycobacterium sp.]
MDFEGTETPVGEPSATPLDESSASPAETTTPAAPPPTTATDSGTVTVPPAVEPVMVQVTSSPAPPSPATTTITTETPAVPEAPVTPEASPTPEAQPLPPPAAEVVPPVIAPPVENLPPTDDETVRRRSPGVNANALSPLQILRLLSGSAGLSFPGHATAAPERAGTAATMSSMTSTTSATSFGTREDLARASSVSMAARVTPDPALPEGLRLFLNSYGQMIIAASLSAMAAAALPGLAGFLLPVLAGMRIGYRQAKSGRALRASGIARFAGAGPIGIVRSGSVVALRPSARRAARVVDTEDVSSQVA